jgi:signal peptidase II
MRKNVFKYIAAIVILLAGCHADFHTKKWAKNNLQDKPTITIFKNVLDLGYSENRGMIFGIQNGKMSELSRMVVVVLRLIIFFGLLAFIWVNRERSFLFLFPFLLFSDGAIGNLIDPFVYGYVVDFIHIQAGAFFNWPFYFNLADAYITIGFAILLVFEAKKAIAGKKPQKPIA